jgi:hypothetical protein
VTPQAGLEFEREGLALILNLPAAVVLVAGSVEADKVTKHDGHLAAVVAGRSGRRTRDQGHGNIEAHLCL